MAPKPTQIARLAMNRALTLNRRAVLGHLSWLRRANPTATPTQLLRALEREYLAAVAASGGAAGAAAAVPAVGTVAGLAINVAEIPVFVEASVLFILCYAEIHGVPVEDLERRRMLVYAILLGQGGTATVTKMAGRTGPHWGKSIVRGISMETIDAINKVLGRYFVTKWGTKQGILVLGRDLPLGIGAGIGAVGNTGFGYLSVRAARRTFGAPPATFPDTVTTAGLGPDSGPGSGIAPGPAAI